MKEIRNKTANGWGRGLVIAIALLMTLGLVHTQALAWGSATHAYIANILGASQGTTANLNEIYGAMAPDASYYLFGSPYQLPLYYKAHYEAMNVWKVSKNGKFNALTQAAAYGFVSHNDDWGADYTAHHQALSPGFNKGYVIAKTQELLPYFPLVLPDAVATELTHLVVEIGVDVLMQKLDDQIGVEIMESAQWRTSQFPDLLLLAYPAPPLSSQDAALLGAETYFRNLIGGYGFALTLPQDRAVELLAEQFATMADAFLAGYGLPPLPPPLPGELSLEDQLELYILGAMALCQNDFAQEINLTIAYVDEQLKAHSVSAVPAPPAMLLMGTGLLGLGAEGLRRRRRS